MRKAIVGLAVLAFGCSEGAVGPQGPQGERGPEGPPGGTAEVASLRAELAAVKAELAMVAAARKVPHLVAEDGSDLGRWTGGSCFWSDAMSGEVCLGAPPVAFYFAAADCTGEPMLSTPPSVHSSRLVLLGSVAFRVPLSAEGSKRPVGSMLSAGACSNYDAGNEGSVYGLERVGDAGRLPAPHATFVEYR